MRLKIVHCAAAVNVDKCECIMCMCDAVYIQANLEDDIVKEALKTVRYHHCSHIGCVHHHHHHHLFCS